MTRWGVAAAAATTVAVVASTRVTRVEVHGASMEPTLWAGDRLVVRRTRAVAVGDLVVAADPRGGRPWVKRVADITPAGVDLRGDRPDASTDSRHVGPVRPDAVLGRVTRRYHQASDAAGRD